MLRGPWFTVELLLLEVSERILRICMCMYTSNFSAFGVSFLAIYENRYFILFAKNSNWKHWRKIFLPFMCIFVPLFFLPPFLQIPDQEIARLYVQKEIPCLNLTSVQDRELFVLSMNSNLPGYCVIIGTFAIIGSTGIIFLLTLYQLFKRNKSFKLSSRSYQLQKNFLIAITLQSFLSFIFIIVPVNIILYVVVFWYYNQVLNNIMCLMFSMFGLETCVVMILVHKPYREFAISLILCFRKRTVKTVENVSIVFLN